MSDSTSTDTTALTQKLEGQAEQDTKDALKQDLPGIEADAEAAGDDIAQDLDKLGDDVVNLAADIGTKLFGDAKADMQQFIDKLPQPMPYLLQGMAGSAEAVIDSIGTQAYHSLQAREKELIEKTKQVCGTGLALVEAFFDRQTK